MKRKKKKLALHRETVKILSKEHLGQAGAGGETYELITGCACTDCCGGGQTGNCGSGGCGGTQDTCTCIFPLSNCFCP